MSIDRPLDVLVVGDLFAELVMSGFSSWPPAPGQEIYAERFFREVGGGAAITASGLAKLGVKTGVLGSVGCADSEWLFERLRSNRVDTTAIQQSAGEPTATTLAVSTRTDRTFLTYMGANRELPAILKQAETQTHFSKARHVHVAHAPESSGFETLIRSVSEQKCSVSLDVGWHPEWLGNPDCHQALRQVDIFFPNENEASRMTGETDPARILQAFEKMGLRKVALKLGSFGAALLYDGATFFQQPIAVDAVDPTGAGDCFDAGFLFAWLRGDSPQTCLKAASICGALSTRRMGGIDGFPTLTELEGQL
jgi:sugar/nucleoside kinase (ribokinase family)